MKNKKGIITYGIISIVAIMLLILKINNDKSGTSDIYIQGFLLLVTILTIGILYFKKNISNKTKIGLTLMGIVLFINYPLYNDYLVYQHDIEFNMIRLNGLKGALENFQIPARVYPLVNNGYGYAVPMFYPDLFMYFPAILRVLNVSAEFSYKILLFLINMAAVFSMYISVKKISKSTSAGIIGSVIYATATYRLVDVFSRGAIGESLALAFFPLAIWGLYELCIGNKKKWYIFAIGSTCIIQSHILSLITFAIVCVVILLYFIKNIIKEKRYKQIILSGAMIILINLWFIVPFLQGYSLDLSVKETAKGDYYGFSFSTHNVIPAQVFNLLDDINSYRQSQDINSGMENEMNYSLGLFCTIGIILCIVYIFKNKNNSNNDNKFIKILTLLGIAFLLLSTSIIPWKELEQNVKAIKWVSVTMQFAWRFLGPATVAITMAMSIIIGKYVDSKYDKNKSFVENYKIVFGIGLTSIVVFTIIVAPYSKEGKYTIGNWDPVPYPEYYLKETNTSLFYENNYNTSGSISISKYEKNGSKIILDYTNYTDGGYIEVPLLYYPGYVAKDENGNKLDITIGNNNVVRINLNDKKSGTITVDYKEKPLYIFADMVSLVTICAFIIYRIRLNKKNNNYTKGKRKTKEDKFESGINLQKQSIHS